MDRDLDWDGCVNVRDLGGLRDADDRTVRRGAVVRSDNPAYLLPRAGSRSTRTEYEQSSPSAQSAPSMTNRT